MPIRPSSIHMDIWKRRSSVSMSAFCGRQRTGRNLRRKSDAALQISQRMEAIGRLAGGIAHDFNNILTVIIGYSEGMLGRLGQQHGLRREVEGIHHAGLRAAELTRKLLAISRKQIIV